MPVHVLFGLEAAPYSCRRNGNLTLGGYQALYGYLLRGFNVNAVIRDFSC